MEDLRTQKTRKAIEQATIELIEEKGFSKLRINEIAQRAIVNRNTIYLHYQSKEDIVVSILEHHFSFERILMVAGKLLKTKMSREELRKSYYELLEAMEKDIYLFFTNTSNSLFRAVSNALITHCAFIKSYNMSFY